MLKLELYFRVLSIVRMVRPVREKSWEECRLVWIGDWHRVVQVVGAMEKERRGKERESNIISSSHPSYDAALLETMGRQKGVTLTWSRLFPWNNKFLTSSVVCWATSSLCSELKLTVCFVCFSVVIVKLFLNFIILFHCFLIKLRLFFC